jgi:O-acetyl-ADP-ribose deacetylase (regulator of RNase III)
LIHVVIPVRENLWTLKYCCNSILKCFKEKFKTIGVCCISITIFGYDINKATHIAMNAALTNMEQPENLVKIERHFLNQSRYLYIIEVYCSLFY